MFTFDHEPVLAQFRFHVPDVLGDRLWHPQIAARERWPDPDSKCLAGEASGACRDQLVEDFLLSRGEALEFLPRNGVPACAANRDCHGYSPTLPYGGNAP